MRVIGLPEFQRCMEQAVRTSKDDEDLHKLLKELASRRESAEMRADSIRIEGTSIQLWATKAITLTTGEYRITWRYEERDSDDVVVCFTLAEF